MFALPTRDGGLGIPVLGEVVDDEYQASLRVTAPLAALMVLQSSDLPNSEEIHTCKGIVSAERRNREKEKLDTIEGVLPQSTARAFKQAQGKGASSWLTTLFLKERTWVSA